MKHKFRVAHLERGEVEGAFVLLPDRDPAAVDAIRAYAQSTADSVLAAQLDAWADRIDGGAGTDVDLRVTSKIALWTGILAEKVKAGTMSVETALQRIAGHAVAAVRREYGDSTTVSVADESV